MDDVVRGPEGVEHAEREVLQRVGGGLPVQAYVRAGARRRGRHLHCERLAARHGRQRRVVAMADGADLVHPDLALLRVGRPNLVYQEEINSKKLVLYGIINLPYKWFLPLVSTV